MTKPLKISIPNKQLKFLLSALLFIAQFTVTHGQINNDRVDGVYLNIDQYISNEPDAVGFRVYDKSDPESSLERPHLQRSFCTMVVETEESVDDVWGFALDGRAFVKYQGCYFPIGQVGQLSTFYYNRDKLIKVVEYVLPVRNTRPRLKHKVLVTKTGEILDQDTQYWDIVGIIQSDPSFTGKYIKRKELGIYISEYNKKHPLSELVDK